MFPGRGERPGREVAFVVDIDQIPAEVRWRLATAGAMDLSMAYAAAIRSTVGEAFEGALDEMEVEFWRQAGLEQVTIARAFGFPLQDALKVARAFTTISILFQGPELGVSEIVDAGGDAAVIRLKTCPALARARKFHMDEKRVCLGCRAYSRAAVEALNPVYTLSHGKSMCLGDPLCEVVIAPGTKEYPRDVGGAGPQDQGTSSPPAP